MIGIEQIGFYKKGSGIHIKKKNRGKFTTSAKRAGKSVLQHARDVLANPNATPLQKKRANFARNAAHWSKKLNGGPIYNGGTLPEVTKTASKLSLLDKLKMKIMTSARNTSRDVGKSFLLDRDKLRLVLEGMGFSFTGYDDYGVVKKAVGNKKYPVFLQSPDVISRDSIIPLGNIDVTYDYENGTDLGIGWYGTKETALTNAGAYRTAIYKDPKTNKLYQKGWDLNDYGGQGGTTNDYLGKIADYLGNPFVVNTGILEILPEYYDTVLQKLHITKLNKKKDGGILINVFGL